MPRHLITCALPAVTGHGPLTGLGSSVLPADAYCRFLRACGEEVLFVCASGEHGTRVELAAARAGLDVASYCGRLHGARLELASGLGISSDVLGRSCSARNAEQTQYFVRRLEQEGYVEARSTRQPFSPRQGRFLADRLLVGTCPRCGDGGAHGDWCGACGRPLETSELIEPRAASCDDPELEPRESRHLFFLRSKLAEELRIWLESGVGHPGPAPSSCLQWLDEGLRDWRITRDLPWGVPVDRTGFEGAVYHEWLDAPIAYIGATREWAEAGGDPAAWRRWWCAREDVRLVQFMTREEIPFHTMCFPLALIGSREAWKLADAVKAFERLTYYGDGCAGYGVARAFIGEAPAPAGADCLRYRLLGNASEADEESFSWEAFAATVNAELVAIARFVDRSLVFVERRFGSALPTGGAVGREEELLTARVDAGIEAITARISTLEFRAAVSELRSAWALGGDYLERKRPLDAPGADREEAALTARTLLNLIALLARLSTPVIPFSAARLLDALAVPARDRGWPARFEPDALAAGHRFSRPPPLFGPIEAREVEWWRRRFGDPRAPAPSLASP
jgi:methionyl-tRNA synthetase